MRRFWITGLVAAATLLAPAAQAGGRIYKHVDERGLITFSDMPVGVDYSIVPRAPSRPRRLPSHNGYDSLILRAARSQRLEPALVKAVIAAESDFNPRAVSRAGAVGLMQLMPQTAERMGVEDALQPEQNVRGGTRYLRAMLDRYRDLSHALAAYNAGPKAVDRHRGIPPYKETRAYVARVLDYYHGYHPEFLK